MLQVKLNRCKKGKRPTLEGTENNVSKILSTEYMKDIFNTSVSFENNFVNLKYNVNQNAISHLTKTVLGKTILFTDNHEWSNEQIIRAYRSQYKIEHAFREMKNPHFLSWNPRWHWTDQKIRVHAFYCVAALTLVSLLRREIAAKGLNISTYELMTNLNNIRESIIVYTPAGKNKSPRLSHSMTTLTNIQKKLYNLLNLAQYMHS
jgi:transposase